MSGRTIAIIFLFFIQAVFSDESPIQLEHVNINTKDYASILRGAKVFSGTCMTCHTMKYVVHDKIAKEAGITADKMPLNQKEWVYGITPPDLSLEARVQGADWIYTYLHAFYKDASRPTGFNNLLVPNTVMTNVLAGMQGIQEKLPDSEIMKPILQSDKLHYFQVLKLVQSGSQSPEAFDDTTRDLVNFFVYISDPHVNQRKRMGIYVLIFLALFFVIVYWLKKMVWKKV
ncbi:MAG: hypothetical protein A3C44_04980 [Gammaproteobacteria bacterium RIFCSPHIGHO2_02_FULL_39_13]|nr:MAG: hypothetical protein A3C44_04980 [Gammaproteobacteria bacterium RIFCSPHIGHO2_02_FULL_39_13]OGT50551.1 MAG: hypothetical protein A3E53_03415 [Gammaproteobacteria bacterium RIFCSPHIGHO2_12_FULL_39_24]